MIGPRPVLADVLGRGSDAEGPDPTDLDWIRDAVAGVGSVPYVRGSDTSREAAARIRAHAPTDRMKVLAWLLHAGDDGATDDEIEVALGLRHQTASPRRRGLVKDGLVEAKDGVKRKTRSGRKAQVWVLRYPERVREILEQEAGG